MPNSAEPILAAASPVALRGVDWAVRLPSAFVLLGSLGVLSFAAALEPDPSGIGTHEQFGMAPCGFVERTGLPCATCGMTTSVAHAADGELATAFATQPAGATFAVLLAMAAIVSAWCLTTGQSIWPLVMWCWRPRTVIALAVLIVGAWGYKAIVFHQG